MAEAIPITVGSSIPELDEARLEQVARLLAWSENEKYGDGWIPAEVAVGQAEVVDLVLGQREAARKGQFPRALARPPDPDVRSRSDVQHVHQVQLVVEDENLVTPKFCHRDPADEFGFRRFPGAEGGNQRVRFTLGTYPCRDISHV